MTKRINKISFILIFISFILLMSCNSGVLFTDSFPIPEKTWKLSDIPIFKVPVTDTLTAYDLSFMIRTGSAYPFRNIFFFVTVTSSDGKTITDTLQYALADEKGSWYGKGFGDIHALSLPFKSNVFFPLKGIYIFKIQHGMRIENLKGVYDIGLKVEKIKKQN
jgi:gliding motility-associated lipoprotein GldH